MNKSVLQAEVPFDQYSRQFQVMTVLNELRQSGKTYDLLDVGGYKGRTADFLPKDSVTVMDLFDVKAKGYIKGSALEMPFEDNSFDFVMSFDVLEHIPAVKRSVFVKECARVARRGVVICAPHNTVANELAEKCLDDLYKRLHGEPHPWLKEHIAYGIPDFGLVGDFAKKQGLETVALPSNKLRIWVSIQQAIFTNSKYPIAAERLTSLNSYYNQHFEYDGGDSVEESYRLILCGLFDRHDAELVRSKFGAINRAIPVASEMALAGQVHNYYEVLAAKLDSLQANYRDLHQHEKNRAEELDKNSQELWKRIVEQDKQLQHLQSRQISSIGPRLKAKLRQHLRKKA